MTAAYKGRADQLDPILAGQPPTLLLIAGLPGHGKTTLSLWYCGRHDASLIHLDLIPGKSRSRYAEAQRRVADAIAAGRHAIVDGCALSPDYRARLYPPMACRRAVVWIEPDRETMVRRRPHLEDQADWWMRRAVRPTQSEGFDVMLPIRFVPLDFSMEDAIERYDEFRRIQAFAADAVSRTRFEALVADLEGCEEDGEEGREEEGTEEG